jgi:hypothetical protein
MRNIINTLHKFASIYEKNGDIKEANHYHNLFLKYSNDELPDEDFEDEADVYDSENPPPYLIRQMPIFFNADTNQPIIHNGKYLAGFENDQDLPQIRGKVRDMTGIENMTIVRIPVNILKVEYVQSDSDRQTMDEMQDAFAAGIEDVGDFVYLLMINENIFDVEGSDLVFSSESDAHAFGNVIADYMKSRGKDVDISVAKVAVSLADQIEAGMSMPEMYGDDEFIFVGNSSFKVTTIPETFQDLNRELSVLSQMRRYTVEKLQREKLGDYDYDVDYDEDPDDGGDRFSNTLEKLHKIASVLENNKMFNESEILNDVFMRVAKKKTKKKNVPNDPALYSRCKSEIKKKFDVWPSAYGSAALVKLYKSRGGTYRS